MTFRSRVSILLVIIIIAAMSPGIIAPLRDGEIVAALAVAGVGCVVMSLLFCIRYRIEGDKLYVGEVFRKGAAYDLSKLESITPSRSMLSAPAASLRRIKLDFGCGNALIISPANQDLFIDEVLRINHNVKINM